MEGSRLHHILISGVLLFWLLIPAGRAVPIQTKGAPQAILLERL